MTETEETIENGMEEQDEEKVSEFHLDMPDDVDNMSLEAMEKTIEQIDKGKFVIEKYIGSIERAYDLITEIEHDAERFSDEHKLSLDTLKAFKEKIVDVRKLDLEAGTKLAFAYHIEMLKTAIPEIFTDDMETESKPDKEKETPKSDVEKLFENAPTASVSRIKEIISEGPKILKNKAALLEELKNLHAKMQIADGNIISELLRISPNDDRLSWVFLMENFEKVTELYDQLGKTELVILDTCKKVGEKVFEKLSVCRSNWTAIGSKLERKSDGMSIIVCGPTTSSDQYETIDSLKRGPDSREVVARDLESLGLKIKGIDNRCTKFVLESVSETDKESYEFVTTKLPVILRKSSSRKPMVAEERIYINHHLGKAKDIVSKMITLNVTRAVMAGTFVYKDFAPRRDSSHSERGGFKSRSSYESSRYRSSGGYRGSSSSSRYRSRPY